MDIQSVDPQLLEDHKRLFDELNQIPKARGMTYRTERREGQLIAKPRFNPPHYGWPGELLSRVQHHLQTIWDFFETSSYGVDAITRALIHPDEHRSSKHSIIFLLEQDIWRTDDVYGDYLIEKGANSVLISYYRRKEKRKQFQLPSMTDAEIETWICDNTRQQIEDRFSYLWNYLEHEITSCSKLKQAEFDHRLTAPESVTLDFKETYLSEQGKLGKKEKRELVKDLACFANTNGGTILIGVREDPREVIGTDPKILTEEQIQQIIASYSEPPIPNVRYEIFPHPQGAVIILSVQESPLKPHEVDKTTWIRRGSVCDPANAPEILAMGDRAKILQGRK